MSGTTDGGDDPIDAMNQIEQLGVEWLRLANKMSDICKLERHRVKDCISIANHALVLAMRSEVIAIGDTSQNPDVISFIKKMREDGLGD